MSLHFSDLDFVLEFDALTTFGNWFSPRYVDSASEGANRAVTLIHRLLAFARQQPLAPEAIDGNKLLSGMSDLLRRSLGEVIRIETVLAGGLWRTHADPNQLENAVLNLALNARDAMPDGGKLTIETANCDLDLRYAGDNPGVSPGTVRDDCRHRHWRRYPCRQTGARVRSVLLHKARGARDRTWAEPSVRLRPSDRRSRQALQRGWTGNHSQTLLAPVHWS